MLRKEWNFTYTTKQLADAAAIKRDHHLDRAQWWEDRKAEVMVEVKESGIEVSESLAASYGNTSMGHGPQVMVRNDLQQKLTECFGKIKEHDQKATEYDGWVQALDADTTNPNGQLGRQLHHEDWLYFFGK